MLAALSHKWRGLARHAQGALVSIAWAAAPSFATMTAAAPPSQPAPPPPPPLTLTIDFCASCGYGAWVEAARAVAPSLEATVTGRPVSRTGAFEVWAVVEGGGRQDNTPPYLAWSKLATGQPVGVQGVPAVVQAAVSDARRRLGR